MLFIADEMITVPGTVTQPGIDSLVAKANATALRAQLRQPVEGFDAVLQEAKALEQTGYLERGLDLVYEHIDRLLRDGLFDACNALLRESRVPEMTVDIALTVLTVTLAASEKLPSRHGFFERVERWMRDERVYEDKLLVGLEG